MSVYTIRSVAVALCIGLSSFGATANADQVKAIEGVIDQLRGAAPLIAHDGPVTEDQKVETVRAIDDAAFKLEHVIFELQLESH